MGGSRAGLGPGGLHQVPRWPCEAPGSSSLMGKWSWEISEETTCRVWGGPPSLCPHHPVFVFNCAQEALSTVVSPGVPRAHWLRPASAQVWDGAPGLPLPVRVTPPTAGAQRLCAGRREGMRAAWVLLVLRDRNSDRYQCHQLASHLQPQRHSSHCSTGAPQSASLPTSGCSAGGPQGLCPACLRPWSGFLWWPHLMP